MREGVEARPLEPTMVRAAQYLRMSTDHQRYSLLNQGDAIQAYARARNQQIVRTYADAGRSGLTLRGRAGLQQLISDAMSGNIDFDVLLIYDVSRWGRFQDVDAAAYYEYICRNAGIDVVYCMERFDNDGSPLSAILKSMKRIMAAEFSRDLSVKVFAGQTRVAKMGLHVGGSPGLGLRRQLQDGDERPKGLLKRGEYKALMTDRVKLVRGPAHEIKLVHKIYQMVLDGKTVPNIIRVLEKSKAKTDSGRPWSRSVVMNILTNEKYVGVLVYGKRSQKLKMKPSWNDASLWVRVPGGCEPIVSREVFDAVQLRLKTRKHRLDEDVMLAQLRALYERHGTLSTRLIEREPDMAWPNYFIKRYGSLANAFALVGYISQRNIAYIEARRARWPVRKAILADLVAGFARAGVQVTLSHAGIITLPDGAQIATRTGTPKQNQRNKKLRWTLKLNEFGPKVALIVVVRMAPANDKPVDFCFALRGKLPKSQMKLYEQLKPHPGVVRSDTLEPLFARAQAWIGGAPMAI